MKKYWCVKSKFFDGGTVRTCFQTGGIRMKETMKRMLEAKKRKLEQEQEYFRIDIKNMNNQTYEDNAISVLLEIKKLKTEIAQLEFCLQLQ